MQHDRAKREMMVIGFATRLAMDIRPECMNAAEVIGHVTEALISREDEIDRLRAAVAEFARMLPLDQLQDISEPSARVLVDLGLLHNQQTMPEKP